MQTLKIKNDLCEIVRAFQLQTYHSDIADIISVTQK